MSILNIPYPATLSSEFTLSPATLEDIDDMITCFQAAFDTEAERFWWSPDPETMRPFHRANMEKNMPKTNWRYLKLTQNLSGKLVAWASWVLPKSLGDRGRVLVNSSKEEVPVAAGSEVAKIDDNGKETQRDDRLTVEEKVRKAVSQMNIPQGSSAEGLIHAIVKEELLQEKYNISEMILLTLLCTNPEFGGKGLAKALVQSMLFVSTLEKVPVWVDSSPKGKGFYAKLGFQPVEVTTLDLSLGSKGLTGWHEITLMRWAPPDVTKEE